MGVMAILRGMWLIEVALSICEVGLNTYGISFVSKEALRRAVEDGPWSVMGSYLVVKNWSSKDMAKEVDF
ncbi:hypothetical protein CRYUN_Cryun39dG0072800 [Craigia yunnanensis]